jgi:hypothetical protein
MRISWRFSDKVTVLMETNIVQWDNVTELPKFDAIANIRELILADAPKRITKTGRWNPRDKNLGLDDSVEIAVASGKRMALAMERLGIHDGDYVDDITELAQRISDELKRIPYEDDSPEAPDWN